MGFMKPTHRPPSEETIAAKVPSTIAAEIRRAAREDDRTVSAWLRRHFAVVFGMSPKANEPHDSESR